MQLGAVCDRTMDGEVLEFGTTGYTMNNVFVLYDRNTDSVWYPLGDDTFDGVSGPNKGKTLEFIAKPEVMRLHEWAAAHPGTLVLLPPPSSARQRRAMEQRQRLVAKLVGEWAMATDFNGQTIEAVMTIVYEEGVGFSGTWSSMGADMEMTDILYDGRVLRFTREIGPDQVLEFEGEVGQTEITGGWTGDMGELECSGTKISQASADESPPDAQPDH